MPLDGLTLGFIARELKQKLVGGRVDRVLQPENDEIHLLIRSLGENQRLLLCAGANAARVHLTAHNKQNPQEPPMLCMLLRKHLQGGRVMDVRRVAGDRILEIDIENIDELGVRFPDMSDIYDKNIREIIENTAKENNIELKKGV